MLLDRSLVAEAKRLGANISRSCEAVLIARERGRIWKTENASALESSNSYVEQHGLQLSQEPSIPTAKFDVYRRMNAGPFVLDCQGNLLGALNGRLVTPLLPMDQAPGLQRGCPDIGGRWSAACDGYAVRRDPLDPRLKSVSACYEPCFAAAPGRNPGAKCR
ncbi:type II toxin-antitoxin system CcdA family antitoxin [Sphingobium sp. YBL2]|uniref:type II toxin-antitoxin system CcdA family antitoxin n=1 Tax=Sphingobium sp. (strain YBL2) TaxID=484429 RepID=UPI00307CAA99